MDKGDGSIKYILTGEGAGTTFTIDDSTGDIHAIQRLDRETKAQYVLRAQARNRLSDRPLEPESEFIVKIQDINDNEPRFLDGPYWATVAEMSQIGKNAVEKPQDGRGVWADSRGDNGPPGSRSTREQVHPLRGATFKPPLCFCRNICDPGDRHRRRRPHVRQQRPRGLQHSGGSALLLSGRQNRYDFTRGGDWAAGLSRQSFQRLCVDD